MQIEKRVSARFDIQQSITENIISDEAKSDSKRRSAIQRMSEITMSVYSTISNIPYDPMEYLVINKQATLTRSKSKMISEANSETGKWLNKKLSYFEDPGNVIECSNLLVPRHERTLSGSTNEILAQLEQEVITQWKRQSTGSTISSVSTVSSSDEESYSKKFSVNNNIDTGEVPEEFQDLIEIKEMLITQIFPVISIYRL